MIKAKSRNIYLDILRGVAVVLVLFRHSNLDGQNIMKQFGWLGVDLFFVLSGYLISNILFAQYKNRGEINILRFIVRRCFKILPPFYFFMAISLVFFGHLEKIEYTLTQFLSELFYLQSYLPRIWLHTWSLAVEEHFYILFPFILLFLVRRKLLLNKRFLLSGLFLLLFLSFIIRFIDSYPHRVESFYLLMGTHLRLDGILIGVLISYILNFTPAAEYIKSNRILLSILCSLLILPGFIFSGGGFFMNTIGLTLANTGFGILVMLLVTIKNQQSNNTVTLQSLFMRPIAFVGEASYSIYLWHLNAKIIVFYTFNYDFISMNLLYISLAIVLGIMMWFIIEKPFLFLKNKYVFYNN